MLIKIFLFISGVFVFAVSQVSGEPTIQRFFPELEGYRFVMQREIDQLDENSRIGPFPAAILNEALWRSYSTWVVTPPDDREFFLEVYDLRDPTGAFQLLTLWPTLSGEEGWRQLELAVGNRFLPGQGIFWSGNFFLRVTRVRGTPLTPEDFAEIATGFSEGLALENLLPVTLTHLPKEDLSPGSVQFYLGDSSLALNERFPEPLLQEIGLEDQIEIAYGRYEPDGSALFLIGYPTPALADEYFINLQKSLQNFFSTEGVYMKRAGVVIAVFVGPEQSAQKVLGQVKYAPTIKWLYQKEPETYSEEMMTFFGLITKTILGTGFLLLLIIGAGCVAGLLRYEFLRRFPHIGRGKDTVRLELDRTR